MEEKYINFLKEYNLYNEEIFEYMKDRIVYVDYKNENHRFFIGVYPKVDEGSNIVTDIRMYVPKIVDDISVSMNIHEYVHLISVYNNLNKEYVDDPYKELLPVMYELLYIKSINNNECLDIYKEHIKERVNYLKELLDIFDYNKEYTLKK